MMSSYVLGYLCSGCRLPCRKWQTILPHKSFACVWLGGLLFFCVFQLFFMVTPRDISTLVINSTRFSRDLGALWAHLFLWGWWLTLTLRFVCYSRFWTSLISSLIATCGQLQTTGRRDCHSLAAIRSVGGRLEGGPGERLGESSDSLALSGKFRFITAEW